MGKIWRFLNPKDPISLNSVIAESQKRGGEDSRVTGFRMRGGRAGGETKQGESDTIISHFQHKLFTF